MGADDVGILLAPAIERAWVLAAPALAPLAPLVAVTLRGHVMQNFVPAFTEYTLAEERRVPPPSALPPVPPLVTGGALEIPLPPLPQWLSEFAAQAHRRRVPLLRMPRIDHRRKRVGCNRFPHATRTRRRWPSKP